MVLAESRDRDETLVSLETETETTTLPVKRNSVVALAVTEVVAGAEVDFALCF